MPDGRLKASTGEERASRRSSPARPGQHRLVGATGRLPLAAAKARRSSRAVRRGTGPRASTCTHAPADTALYIIVLAVPHAGVVRPWVAWSGLLGLWYPWHGPRGNDALLGTGGCQSMSACLDFEQTPLRVMIYCAVPEWWLTHQGPLFWGHPCSGTLLHTGQHVLPSQGSLQKPCSWFCSLFGFMKARWDCPAGCAGAVMAEQVSTHQLSRARTLRAPL